MITVTINNSMSNISGLSIKQFKELKDKLSYTIDPSAAYFSGSWKNKRTLLGIRGDFPTGLLYIVENYLSKIKDLQFTDTRKIPAKVKLFTLKMDYFPYPEQEAASYKASEAHRGIIVMPTGVGKSIVAAMLIDNLQVRTLVVVPSLELKKQLTNTLKDCFTEAKVGPLSENKDIAVENVDALDPNKVLEGYDCVIIDEFHHSGAKTYRKLNKKAWKNVYYRFGLTATPFRSQENERLLLESVLSEVIYQLPYQVAVDKAYIVPMEAYYIDLPIFATDGYSWQEVYSELVVYNSHRNNVIVELMSILKKARCSTICLVKEIQHGINIQNNLSNSVDFIKGENLDNRITLLEFGLKEKDVIIGTTGVLGEGVDTKPAEYIIIAGLGKSKNAFMQQVGRGFRKYPGKTSVKVIIFKDSSHKWTLAHFKAQCKILKDEYGIKPVKLVLDKPEETMVIS